MVLWESEELAPMTVTWLIRALGKVHDSVEEPEPVMLFGVRVQSVLLLLRPTMPLKPFNDPIVSVDVPVEPARTVTLVGAVVMLKSCTT